MESRTLMLITSILLEGNCLTDQGNRKYSENFNSCNETVLVVSNFTEKDINKIFRCSVMEYDCRILTTPKAIHLEYPVDHMGITKQSTMTKSSVTTSITFCMVHPGPNCLTFRMVHPEPNCLTFRMVHPEPNCSFFIHGNDITKQAKIHQENHGHYYSVEYILHHDIADDTICPIEAFSKCKIGSKLMTVLEMFQNCTNPDTSTDELSKLWSWLQLVVIVIVIALVVQSVIRNQQSICDLLQSVRERTAVDLRRPAIALVLFIVCLSSVATTAVLSLKTLSSEDSRPIDSIGSCITSVFMTPILLCFISNPTTVSIRNGFLTAFVNGLTRMRKCLGWSAVPTQPSELGSTLN